MNKKSIFDFLKLMKVDFCLLSFMFSFILHNVTVTQLMEDKMCSNQLNLDSDFCATLTSLHSNETATQTILKKANVFKNWQFVIMSGPALILSIFLGYWLGNYPKFIKPMVILPLMSGICMMVILLINAFAFKAHWWLILLSYFPLALGGGTTLIFSAAYTYISWSTPSNLLIIRFAVLEFMVQSGILVATFVGGKVLAMDPWIAGQPKNYIGVFILGLAVYIIGLIGACLMKLEFTPTTDPDKDKATFIQVLADVFQLSRFQQPAAIFLKKRPNNGRLRLTLLITSGAITLGSILGEDGIAYQFAQRVYGLKEDQYTTMFALVSIIPTMTTSLGPPTLRSFLHLSDSTMAIIGSISMLLFFLTRGIILSTPGFIIGFLLGSFNRLVSASVRTLVSSIVDPAESAQVFTLATCMENYISLGAQFLFTSVFSTTIDQAPGTIMILVACCQIYPLTVFCWSYFTQSQWQVKTIDAENNQSTSIQTVMTVMETSQIKDPTPND